MNSIDVRTLCLYVNALAKKTDEVQKFHPDVKWTPWGPSYQGIFFCSNMNNQVEFLHIAAEDHSLRAYLYASPEKDFERNMPPHMRSYIFSDPFSFTIGSEDNGGKFVINNWVGDMLHAGISSIFVLKIREEVMQAVAQYDKKYR